jgi:nucleoside-diphosphate-sugar epimerase
VDPGRGAEGLEEKWECGMRIIVIGGTGFISGAVVRQLYKRGHELLLFHRKRSTSFPEGTAERDRLPEFRSDFAQFKPDLVLDTILSSARHAEALLSTFSGIAKRVVALSSMDTYRALGVVNRTESGPPDPMALAEDSPLRTRPPYPSARIQMLKSVFQWVDDEYDKVPVERLVMSDSNFTSTILRLPMVYGPGDPLHRLFPILKRIADGRQTIILDQAVGQWRGPRGYVENVAAATVAAVESAKAEGRIYNVAEPVAFTEYEWTKKICEIAGWNGKITILPSDQLPPHLRFPGNAQQHAIADTTRIRRELGYTEIVSIDEAILRTVEWERANPPAQIDPTQYDYAAEDRVLSGTK